MYSQMQPITIAERHRKSDHILQIAQAEHATDCSDCRLQHTDGVENGLLLRLTKLGPLSELLDQHIA